MLSTFGAILLGFEKGPLMKWMGVGLCLFITLVRPLYNYLVTHRIEGPPSGDVFVEKYYVMLNVIFLSIGVLIQKKVVYKNKKASLLVLCFYIYLSAFISSVFLYNVKYWNYNYLDNHAYNNRESFYYYFKYEFLENLGTMLMCILTYAMADAFKYIVLIYENKKDHVSKVSLYYSLHGFYVVLIFLIFEPDKTSSFDYPFIVLIFVGYCLMFFSKYTIHQVVKKNQTQVKFVRKLKHIIEVDLIQSSTEIN